MDDEAFNLSILLEMFGRDYRIVAAKSGAQALKRALKNPPDLILMDVVMPEMDGYTACRLLKENPVTREIPVIFATGLDEAVDGYRGLAAGGADYIRKPYDRRIIRVRIEAHLKLAAKASLLKGLASLDPLTDLPNREHFDRTLESAIQGARARKSPLSLLMVRVDDFGARMKKYGYAAGCACIERVAAVMAESLGEGVYTARRDDDGFAVILPDTPGGEGEKVAEALIARVREAGISHAYSPDDEGPVASVGIGIAAGIPGDADTAGGMAEKADRALEQLPEKGGNRYGRLDL